MRLHRLLFGAWCALCACSHEVPPASPAAAAPTRSTAQLLNTYWKLTELGGQVLATPPGAREIHFVLQSENQRVAGFSGCNRMMGSYALEGDAIRFDQMGGTMMACVPDMELERKFLALFPQIARWRINGETLRLLDADGKTLATFESRYLQ
jgi:heat shock protein HslJ